MRKKISEAVGEYNETVKQIEAERRRDDWVKYWRFRWRALETMSLTSGYTILELEDAREPKRSKMLSLIDEYYVGVQPFYLDIARTEK